MNKQIAAEIGIAEIPVKIHCGYVMEKMGMRSLADLARMPNCSASAASNPKAPKTFVLFSDSAQWLILGTGWRYSRPSISP